MREQIVGNKASNAIWKDLQNVDFMIVKNVLISILKLSFPLNYGYLKTVLTLETRLYQALCFLLPTLPWFALLWGMLAGMT